MIDVWELTGCPKSTFNKWLERGNLKTEFPPSQQGVAREFTKQNALEVSFLTALTNAGFDVGDAECHVDALMLGYKKNKLPMVTFFNHRTGDFKSLMDSDTIGLHNCAIALYDNFGSGSIAAGDESDLEDPDDFFPAAAITAIFPRSIAARVDKAFGK